MFNLKLKEKHAGTQDEESKDALLASQHDVENDQRCNSYKPSNSVSWKQSMFHPFHIGLEAVLGILLTICWMSRPESVNCVEKHTMYSPVNDVIKDEYQVWRFHGNFDYVSPFKGPPTTEVADNWERLWKSGVIRITEEEFQRLDVSPHAVKLPDELGGGRMALLEVTHHLHCLVSYEASVNRDGLELTIGEYTLWKSTWPEYYREDYNLSQSDPRQYRRHTDHCADILRQKLMCDADGGLLTYNWLKNHYKAHPNFNVAHKCRNFDDVLAYAYDKQINMSGYGHDYLVRPVEYVEFDEEPYNTNEPGHFVNTRQV